MWRDDHKVHSRADFSYEHDGGDIWSVGEGFHFCYASPIDNFGAYVMLLCLFGGCFLIDQSGASHLCSREIFLLVYV